MLRQLRIFTGLGLFGEVAEAAQAVVEKGASGPEPDTRCLIFTGHRVDAPGREMPRFPNTDAAIDRAREMIRVAVVTEIEKGGTLVAYSGGASGGDLLFHEICDALSIPSYLLLAMPREDYMRASVNDGGSYWIDRFNETYASRERHGRVLVLQKGPPLPPWLSDVRDYSVWQRNNLWTLSFGLGYPPERARLLALWNGEPGDKLGGTQDMVDLARAHGMGVTPLDTNELPSDG